MKKRFIAIFAVVALLLTLLAIPVFADDEPLTSDVETSEVVEPDTTEEPETTEEAVTTEEPETTEAPAATGTTGTTDSNGDGSNNVVDDPFDIESEGLSTLALWNIILGSIALVAVVAVVIVFFVLPKRREKTLKFFRSLKSEWKKISWYSWKQTWKGTLVVAIVSIVIAVVIGLLDTGFSQGLNALSKFF